MYATACLPALLAALALAAASPYYNYVPRSRQLYYSVVPQYSQYTPYTPYAPVAPAPLLPYRQVYYAPQPPANLIAPVTSVVRYPAPVSPLKQVLYYPGGPYVVGAADGEAGAEGGESWASWINTNYPGFAAWVPGLAPAEGEKPAEAGPAAEAPVAPPTKVEAPAKEEDKEKESEEEKPAEEPKVKDAPKYVLAAQPQFFGNPIFGLQRLNPTAVLPSAQHGAVSSYLLLKNYPQPHPYKYVPQAPQFQRFPQVQPVQQAAQQDAYSDIVPAGQPGAAALDYQKLLQSAQAGRQQKEYEDVSSIVVDAAPKESAVEDDKPADDEVADEEETGTSE